jgi:hypothetical protein
MMFWSGFSQSDSLQLAKKIYSDWCDYYGEAQNKMSADMAADIKWFVEQLLDSNIKLVPKKKLFGFLGRSNRLEWEQNGKWQEVRMSPLQTT